VEIFFEKKLKIGRFFNVGEVDEVVKYFGSVPFVVGDVWLGLMLSDTYCMYV
jgi:hypothetical protein